jgi:hypothetical protein
MERLHGSKPDLFFKRQTRKTCKNHSF